MQENYVKDLRNYLEGRRNIKKKVFKIMFSTYRAVQNGYTDWDNAINWMTGGTK